MTSAGNVVTNAGNDDMGGNFFSTGHHPQERFAPPNGDGLPYVGRWYGVVIVAKKDMAIAGHCPGSPFKGGVGSIGQWLKAGPFHRGQYIPWDRFSGAVRSTIGVLRGPQIQLPTQIRLVGECPFHKKVSFHVFDIRLHFPFLLGTIWRAWDNHTSVVVCPFQKVLIKLQIKMLIGEDCSAKVVHFESSGHTAERGECTGNTRS